MELIIRNINKIVYALLILISISKAQEINLEQLLETEAENQDEVELLEYLQDLVGHPINLNSASKNKLETIPWISTEMAKAIIEFRRRQGHFSSVNELLKIPTIDEETFSIIKHFLTTNWEKSIYLSSRQRIYRPQQLSAGYSNSSYVGGPEKIYNRLKGELGQNYSFSLVAEKDAGEKQLYDHFLGSLKAGLPLFNSAIIFGDYIIETGQGLVTWGPYRFTRDTDPIQAFKQTGRGVIPFASTSEFGSFRGLAVQSAYKFLQMIVFYSSNRLDATTTDSGVSSLITSGLHRTEEEIQKANRLLERSGGLRLSSRGKALQLGLSLQAFSYNKPFAARSGIENSYSFGGRKNHTTGIDFNYSLGPLTLSGEAAQSRNGALSAIGNVLLHWPTINLVVSAWEFSPRFQNFHALALGHNENGNNERGVYLGLKSQISKSLSIAGYIDWYRTRWPTRPSPFPTTALAQMVFLRYRPSAALMFQARFSIRRKSSIKKSYDLFENMIPSSALAQKSTIRLQVDYRILKNLTVRTRIEHNRIGWQKYGKRLINAEPKKGTLLYHQLSWAPLPKVSLISRWCLFDAPDHSVGFYVYENDAPGVMRLTLLQNRGSRFFILTKYSWKNFAIYAKYERTHYDNIDTISSGNNRIESNQVSAISIQIETSI